MYISYYRFFYHKKADGCISGEQVSGDYYFSEKLKRWKRCTSLFCNLHGLKNREDREDIAEKRFLKHRYTIHISLHYGEVADLSTRRKIANRFSQNLMRLLPIKEKLKFSHWQKGKKARHEIFLHNHFLLGTDDLIDRKTFEKIKKETLDGLRLKNPPRLRMGYRVNDRPNKALVYLFRVGKFKDDLVFPPGKLRWELCRMGGWKRKKKEKQ